MVMSYVYFLDISSFLVTGFCFQICLTFVSLDIFVVVFIRYYNCDSRVFRTYLWEVLTCLACVCLFPQSAFAYVRGYVAALCSGVSYCGYPSWRRALRVPRTETQVVALPRATNRVVVAGELECVSWSGPADVGQLK